MGMTGPARVKSEPTSRHNGMGPRVINEILHPAGHKERDCIDYGLTQKKLSSDPYHI